MRGPQIPELDDWVADAGARIYDKRCADLNSLSPVDELIYEIWLLDTESRNGGLSQYFRNHGLAQWKSCCASAVSQGLAGFADFEAAVSTMIAGVDDPVLAIRSGGDSAEDLWYSYQRGVSKELRQLAGNSR